MVGCLLTERHDLFTYGFSVTIITLGQCSSHTTSILTLITPDHALSRIVTLSHLLSRVIVSGLSGSIFSRVPLLLKLDDTCSRLVTSGHALSRFANISYCLLSYFNSRLYLVTALSLTRIVTHTHA